jgi:D-alanyl-D-alanine carboxypeptidase
VTKILTALVILEHGQLSDIVTVSRRAAAARGYDLGLRAGQRVSLEDLLAAILIRSANDAAVAAAEHVGGSVAGFAELMNAKARTVGMTQSHFSNPHGLDEPGHITTARDMAQLTRAALEHPHFAQLVSVREATVNVWQAVRKKKLVARPRLILSHNRLLGRLDGADGVKTGYTGGAGRCLVASATRGGQRMIAVLLNDPDRWTDAELLLEYGFQVAGRSAGPAPAVGRVALEHAQEVLP